MSLALAHRVPRSMTDGLSPPSGVVAAVYCLVFKPGGVLLRSYPNNNDDDDAKELSVPGWQSWRASH